MSRHQMSEGQQRMQAAMPLFSGFAAMWTGLTLPMLATLQQRGMYEGWFWACHVTSVIGLVMFLGGVVRWPFDGGIER